MSGLADLVRFQIAHSAWALRQIIRHAKALPVEATARDLGIGPGSLRANVAHTIEAMLYFAENFAGREHVEPAEFAAESGSLDGLDRLLGRASASLRESMLGACAREQGASVPWPNAEGGSLPAAVAIAQVVDHPTLHRAQCVNMLRRLGVAPVPDLDPMTFRATGLPW